MEKEEGEMSDDNVMFVDELDPRPIIKLDDLTTTMYKADKHGFQVQHVEKVDAAKLEERARRFGLDLSGSKVITQNQIDDLYAHFAIESDNERHFRFDTIHLNGINGLTSKEIFEYLEDFKPVSLEWIDEVSCNVVCQDNISAALALLVQSREIKNNELKEVLALKSYHNWREGMPHPNKDLILMRFATNGDKKMNKKKSNENNSNGDFYDLTLDTVNKNPWGDLCKTWGVYDHQEFFRRTLPGKIFQDDDENTQKVIIKNKKFAQRLGKRTHEDEEVSGSETDWKTKSKTPRMRMRADDEEFKQKKKNSTGSYNDDESSNERNDFAPLSVEVVNCRPNCTQKETTILSEKFTNRDKWSKKKSIQSRLGSKVMVDDSTSDDSSVDGGDRHVLSRVEKITTSGVTSNVWSRLENKMNESDTHNDLRHILKSKRHKKPDDLRDRLSKNKTSNLRIEIDNNYARR